MANIKEFFLTGIQRIFSNWTALRLTVEHGMGSKDSAVEFCTYMTEVLSMNDDLSTSEVVTVLEDYMAECFNTEMEDGSAAEVAEILVKFYRYCTENEESTVKTELEKLPPLQPWLLFSQPVQQNCSAVSCDDSRSPNENVDTDEMDTNEDEEGWTTVRRR
ncbi:uncharacterized protein LOC116848821 [Odontomachus brunneus]|uniref:uncharacterized protein LOC116848821 n=1 Tax=Odontomachus brunneus TaxID=486640 RepID=UPI0013F2949B|nr:uncharacterized protein LOC116848821 [Odontomachus brunneus]